MVKIDFVNATEPAINDTNLNQMQLNIENAINAQVAGDTLPVGSIMPYTSDTVPENWLICDGSAISRTTYDLLFSVIGTTYGVGDGSTTFNLPNLKGKVPVGKDSTQTEFDTLGETGGEKTHTLTIEEMPSHDHYEGSSYGYITTWNHIDNNYSVSNNSAAYKDRALGATNSQTDGFLTKTTGGGQAHNNLQPYIVGNYIIKAKQSAGVVATVVDNLTSTSATDALSANQGRILNASITSLEGRFDYSATEKVVGTWISGKPLYEKTFTINVVNIDTTYETSLNVQNLGEYWVDWQNSYHTFVNNNIKNSIPPLFISGDSWLRTFISDGKIQSRTNQPAYTGTSYITVRYTKTTD